MDRVRVIFVLLSAAADRSSSARQLLQRLSSCCSTHIRTHPRRTPLPKRPPPSLLFSGATTNGGGGDCVVSAAAALQRGRRYYAVEATMTRPSLDAKLPPASAIFNTRVPPQPSSTSTREQVHLRRFITAVDVYNYYNNTNIKMDPFDTHDEKRPRGVYPTIHRAGWRV